LLSLFGLAGSAAVGQGFPAEIALGGLTQPEGVIAEGVSPNGLFGYQSVGAGDVNGDGVDDLLISAPQAGESFSGEVYLFFGGESLPNSLPVGGLDGSNGAVFRGSRVGESTGVSLAGVGDFDGDGLDDFVIGAPFATADGRQSAGKVYLIYGRTGYPPVVALDTLDASLGVVLEGASAFDSAGLAVGGGGDVNGDGRPDLIVGAHRSDAGGGPNAGAIYTVFGTPSSPAVVSLSDLDGTNGFTLLGVDGEDEAGASLSSAGDVNGDGFDDILIGARRADPGGRAKAGEVYVFYGGTDLAATIELAGLDGTNGFVMVGIDEDDEAGFAVSGVGDVNGDGFDDVAMSAPVAFPDFIIFAGETYIVYGGDDVPAVTQLSGLDGENGTLVKGIEFGDTSGDCVRGVGDVNRDGFDDLLIGATLGDPAGLDMAGEAYVVLGGAALGAEISLGDLEGSNGSLLSGAAAGDLAGLGCGGAGDVNGDAVPDLVVGAIGADPNGTASGSAYVVFGRAEATVSVSGTCPGDVLFEGAGFSSGGTVRVVSGSDLGTATVPVGPCAGTTLDLAGASLVATLVADGAGSVAVTRTLAAGACDLRLQWLDESLCRVSNVVSIP